MVRIALSSFLIMTSLQLAAATRFEVIKKIDIDEISFGPKAFLYSEQQPNIALRFDWNGWWLAWDIDRNEMIWKKDVSVGADAITLSPDGRKVLAGGNEAMDQGLSVFDVFTGEHIYDFEFPQTDLQINIDAVGFSKDQKFTVSGGTGQKVQGGGDVIAVSSYIKAPVFIHNFETGKIVKQTRTDIMKVFKAGFSDNGEHVYAAAAHEFKVWETTEGEEIKRIHLGDILGEEYFACRDFFGCGPDHMFFNGASFSPGMRFVVLADPSRIHLINLESLKLVASQKLPDEMLFRAMNFTKNSEKLTVLASKAYRDTSETVLLTYRLSDFSLEEKVPGGEIPLTSNSERPANTIMFFNDNQNIMTAEGGSHGDNGRLRHPSRVPLLYWGRVEK